MSDTQSVTHDEIHRAFETGDVFNKSDDVLMEYLRVLNTGGIPNENVRHRAINHAITVNTLINLRFIKSVERSNRIYTWVVIILAMLSLAASVIQIAASVIQIITSI